MKSVYIIFTHSIKPHFNRMGRATDQWESFENVEFVDRIKDRHLSEATAIVDYLKEKVVKCREQGVTYDKLIDHANKQYPDQMAQLDQLILALSENLVDRTEAEEKSEEESEESSTTREESSQE